MNGFTEVLMIRKNENNEPAETHPQTSLWVPHKSRISRICGIRDATYSLHNFTSAGTQRIALNLFNNLRVYPIYLVSAGAAGEIGNAENKLFHACNINLYRL